MGKKLDQSIQDVRDNEQIQQRALEQMNDANIRERWGDMFKPQQPIVHKPLALTNQGIRDFTFGPDDGLDWDKREFVRSM